MTSTKIGSYNPVGGFFPAGSLTWGNVAGIAYARISDSAPTMLSRDGGALTSTGTTFASGTANFTAFGAFMGPPPSQGWGDVNEIIFIPYNSSDSVRQKLEGYLAYKWGLTGLLPAGHPYKTALPYK
jgi:hypothetical protein